MPAFRYFRPTRLDEALTILAEHGSNARILSGGTDLLVKIRRGRLRPAVVVDLKGVADLRIGMCNVGGVRRVGADVVMTDVLADPIVARHFTALADAARVVGSVQIRNRASLVGNICNASPAADTAPALLVYDARVGMVGPGGARSVSAADFFTGPGRTVVAPGEIVTWIDLPLPEEGRGAAFGRITRRKGVDLATINLCGLITVRGHARFAFGAVGPTPLLAVDDTGALAAGRQDAPDWQAALARLYRNATPITDVRGGSDYRAAMIEVMTRRVWHAAAQRLQAQQGGS